MAFIQEELYYEARKDWKRQDSRQEETGPGGKTYHQS